VRNIVGGADHARTAEIVADAAHVVLTREAKSCTGNFFVDEDVLREAGVSDFSKYLVEGAREEDLRLDIYLD